jgi:hypothetical protein
MAAEIHMQLKVKCQLLYLDFNYNWNALTKLYYDFPALCFIKIHSGVLELLHGDSLAGIAELTGTLLQLLLQKCTKNNLK